MAKRGRGAAVAAGALAGAAAGAGAGGAGGGGRRPEDTFGELFVAKTTERLASMFTAAGATFLAQMVPGLANAAKGKISTEGLTSALKLISDTLQLFVGSDIPRGAVIGAFDGLIAAVNDPAIVTATAALDKPGQEGWIKGKLDAAFAVLGGALKPNALPAGPKAYAFLETVVKLPILLQQDLWLVIRDIENSLAADPAKAVALKSFRDGLRELHVSQPQLEAIMNMTDAAQQKLMLQRLFTPPPSKLDDGIGEAEKILKRVRGVVHSPKGAEAVRGIETQGRQFQRSGTLFDALNLDEDTPASGFTILPQQGQQPPQAPPQQGNRVVAALRWLRNRLP